MKNGRLGCSEAPSVELVLVLLPEAVPRWEELPAALLVHFPHVRFLKMRVKLRVTIHAAHLAHAHI